MKDGDWFGKWIVSFFDKEIHFSSSKNLIKIHSDGSYTIEDKEED